MMSQNQTSSLFHPSGVFDYFEENPSHGNFKLYKEKHNECCTIEGILGLSKGIDKNVKWMSSAYTR